MMGREAFLEPPIATQPTRGRPPATWRTVSRAADGMAESLDGGAGEPPGASRPSAVIPAKRPPPNLRYGPRPGCVALLAYETTKTRRPRRTHEADDCSGDYLGDGDRSWA